MKILLDHNLPKALRLVLGPHLVLTARQMGWDTLTNGHLIAAAESNEFAILLTADNGVYYQQNNVNRRISLVLLTATRMPLLEPMLDAIRESIDRARPGSFERIMIPLPSKVRK